METIEVSVGGWMDGCIKNTHTQNGMLLNHKKEWNLAICDNMDGSWAHYAKWNKSDREVEILHESTYEVSRIVKFVEIESRMVVFRGWVR